MEAANKNRGKKLLVMLLLIRCTEGLFDSQGPEIVMGTSLRHSISSNLSANTDQTLEVHVIYGFNVATLGALGAEMTKEGRRNEGMVNKPGTLQRSRCDSKQAALTLPASIAQPCRDP